MVLAMKGVAPGEWVCQDKAHDVYFVAVIVKHHLVDRTNVLTGCGSVTKNVGVLFTALTKRNLERELPASLSQYFIMLILLTWYT